MVSTSSKGFLLREIACTRCRLFQYGLLANVCRITPRVCFIPMQQVRQYPRAVHFCGGDDHQMNQFGFAIHANVHLHAEIPLNTLLRLMCIRISLLVPIFGRGWRVNDRCVHDGAVGNIETVLGQKFADPFENLAAQSVSFQQMANLSDRGFVWHRFLAQINTEKTTHRSELIQRFFGAGIAEVEPVLQKIYPQHALRADRWSAVAGLWIEQRNHGTQFLPRDRVIHLGQKQLVLRRLAVGFKRACCKGQLIHRFPSSNSFCVVSQNDQELIRDSLAISISTPTRKVGVPRWSASHRKALS